MSAPNDLGVSTYLDDESRTLGLAQFLAKLVQNGDLILLQGDLGAGKSTFARQMIRTLVNDQTTEVPSPTFLLVLPYAGNGRSILHTDLYRLVDPQEVDELGLDDDPSTIVLVEWPDRDPALFDRANLVLNFKIDPARQGRIVNMHFVGDSERSALLKQRFSQNQ